MKRVPTLPFLTLSLAALALCSAGCAAAAPTPPQAVEGHTAFALDLYRVLKEEPGNLFFSPYSLSAALTMTYGGARGNTALEMQKVLHLAPGDQPPHQAFAALDRTLARLQKKGRVQLQIANALWPQEGYPFLPEYLDLIKKNYGGAITPLDYHRETEAARQTINRWVEDKTQDKIRELIQPGSLSDMTRLVLVNAIYFKGNWASQFDRQYTADADFHVSPQQTVKARMMTQTHPFPYADLEDVQVVELPYAGEDLSMLVILPKETNGLSKWEERLTPDQIRHWRQSLAEQEVCVRLPKFKITWGTKTLNQPLEKLGLIEAFDDQKADFTGMSIKRPGLFIDLVLHKAFVEVNEEGTEAAAATAVVMMEKSLPRPKPVFNADHPFVFLIQDRGTGSLLFLGRINDPTS